MKTFLTAKSAKAAKIFVLCALCVLCGSISAQSILTAEGLSAFGTNAVAGGGGGGTPSYSNTGGTGDRHAIITVVDSSSTGSSIVAGSGGSQSWVNNAALATGQSFFNGSTGDGVQYWVRFDFGSPVLITEAKFYQQDSTSQGTWKWQGSADASSWTDIGGNFTLVTAPTTTLTSMSANTSSYRYYRMLMMSGTTSGGPWTFQMEFKIFGL